ncbi:nucleolar protein, partial [Spiromyces aspiralis]
TQTAGPSKTREEEPEDADQSEEEAGTTAFERAEGSDGEYDSGSDSGSSGTALPSDADEDEVVEAELLAGVDTSDSEGHSEFDSEDEDSAKPFEEGKGVIALDKKSEQRLRSRLNAAEKSEKPGVMYLGRIPHGFYEKEMKAYFSQFGMVNRLRLSRNKKTGRSKHYAFIEFASADVARIVAETMHNYMLYDHLLQARVIPEDKVHPALFAGADRKFKVVPWHKIQRARHNRERTPQEHGKIVKRLIKKEKRKRDKFRELGIDYEFPGYESVKPPSPKHVRF